MKHRNRELSTLQIREAQAAGLSPWVARPRFVLECLASFQPINRWLRQSVEIFWASCLRSPESKMLLTLSISLICLTATQAAEPPKAKIAIVGGTFINDALFGNSVLKSSFTVPTPSGESPKIHYGEVEGVPFYYVHMHGEGKWVATWQALAQLGVKEVLGGATAGGINVAMKIYDCVVPHDFIDVNVDRPKSISLPDRPGDIPRYVPPMDPLLRQILIDETRRAVRAQPSFNDINVLEKGVIVQAAGGRFETAAEIAAFQRMGGDLVTMSVGTEISYARQLGINYACLVVISNPAEGIGAWTWDDIRNVYPRMNPLCVDILLKAVPRVAKIGDGPREGDKLRFHPPMTSKKEEKK